MMYLEPLNSRLSAGVIDKTGPVYKMSSSLTIMTQCHPFFHKQTASGIHGRGPGDNSKRVSQLINNKHNHPLFLHIIQPSKIQRAHANPNAKRLPWRPPDLRHQPVLDQNRHRPGEAWKRGFPGGELTFQVLGVVLFGARHLHSCAPGVTATSSCWRWVLTGAGGWLRTHSSADLRRRSRRQMYFWDSFSAFIYCAPVFKCLAPLLP